MESSLQPGEVGHTSWKAETLERSRGWIIPERRLRQSSKSDPTAAGAKWGPENGQTSLLIKKQLAVTSRYSIVICRGTQVGSDSLGQDWTRLSLRVPSLSLHRLVKPSLLATPTAQLPPRNIPSYRTPRCRWKRNPAGRAGVAVGSLASPARLTLRFLQKPRPSCEWQAVPLWGQLSSIPKAALPLFCVWSSLQWLTIPEIRMARV